MGINVKPPVSDETAPACGAFSFVHMPRVVVTVNNVEHTSAWPYNTSPNGTRILYAVAPCQWSRDRIVWTDPEIIEVTTVFYNDYGLYTAIGYRGIIVPVYYCYKEDVSLYGMNELTGMWYGGAHQIAYIDPNNDKSLNNTAEGLGLNIKRPTFAECMGVDVGGNQEAIRFASLFDHTCVTIKRT
jgi:hypothetical protein